MSYEPVSIGGLQSQVFLRGFEAGDQNRHLTDRERAVVCMRFGLIDGKPKKLDEIGREMGVSRERIRQIVHKAGRKLAFSFNKHMREAAL